MNAKKRFDTIAWAVASVFSIAAVAPVADAANTNSTTDKRAVQEQTKSTHAMRNLRASNLIGKDVRNAQGEDLGDIKDVIVDMNDARIHYVVLSFGGFMGLGDKQFAFPATAFRTAADKDELVLNIDKERLKKAPGFEQGKAQDWNDPAYRNQVDRYFGEMYRVQPSGNTRLVRASDLIGKDLNTPEGRDAGEIQDLVVSLADGRVRYAVVTLDKTWGPEDRRYAMPLKVFKPGQRMQDDFVVNVQRDLVARAPSFEKDRWPDLNDSGWTNQIDRFTLAYGAGALAPAGRDAIAAAKATKTSDADRDRQAMQERRAVKPDQQASATQRNMRLSQLIGKDVRNAQGEDLGDIKDVVVDMGNGRVHYVVLSFGGMLGLGDKQFAYPMQVFRPSADKDELVLNVDKERLKKAPGFEQAREPDWNQAEYRGQVDRYFGDMVRVEPRPNMRLIRGSNLIGKDVNGANGEHIGEIEDVVVSLAGGDARYAVVAFDKAWSLDEKRFVFPLKAFHTGPRLQDDFTLNVTRDMLARVPSFERNQWPDLDSARWNVDVDRYLLTMTVTPLPPTTKATRPATQPEAASNASQARQMFDRLDKDKDGRISRAEFNAAHQQ